MIINVTPIHKLLFLDENLSRAVILRGMTVQELPWSLFNLIARTLISVEEVVSAPTLVINVLALLAGRMPLEPRVAVNFMIL